MDLLSPVDYPVFTESVTSTLTNPMPNSTLKLHSARLILVPVSTKYTKEVFKEYREPLTKYMHHPSAGTLAELTERTKKWERQIDASERLFMAVLLKETEEFLGCFSLENIKESIIEMGGWLKKSAHGNRYGQEAAATLKQWADANLDYEYIKWPCAKENIGSCKVAESLGGKVAREYEKTNTSGYTWDFVEYRIMR